MGDYPDPDEEFELMYGDELENKNKLNAEKSLNFNTPSGKNKEKSTSICSDTQQLFGSNSCTQSQSDHDLNKRTAPSNSTQGTVEELFGDITDIGEDLVFEQQPVAKERVELFNSKKRTADELFGDITDIGNDDLFSDIIINPRKKKKASNSNLENEEKNKRDFALIEHILQLRQLAKDQHCVTVSNKDHSTINLERDKRNLSYRVPKYPFIGVTRHDKERVYIRFHSEEYEKEESERVIKDCSFGGVMGDTFKEVWQEAQLLINNQMDIDVQSLEVTDDEISVVQQEDETTKLWVDLYKPRKYLELLSDESTNRIMLRWIKLWDKVVFNRKPKIKLIKPEDPNKKFFKFQELSTELDEHDRPHYKVALLCGPPGLGKTTLAHMVAKHAGYNVVEINASDDRSPEAFKTSLENATQMRSVLDQERRPNCLIFDEIDGAPQTSIDYLVKFISGIATSKSKKGKHQKQFILKRPIICICNDVYVPALRPLRQIAFVVNFPSTSSVRLSERLMEIARRQQIKTDLGAMLALAEKSNNDIRSCLSVLHFFKVQNKPVTLFDVHRASIGQKDMQKGLFSVWNDIFQITKTKSSTNSPKDTQSNNLKFRMAKILHVVSSFGDYERVAQGVFENFPRLKLKDSSLSGISQSLEWFVFTDLINHEIHSLQNYSLTGYLQYAFVVWHFKFATMQHQKLNYPTVAYEVRTKENRRKALIAELLRGMRPSVRIYCQTLSLILDMLPFLMLIITPPFRPVSLHLYTKEERANMLKVVHIMIDYNLNYVQERTPEGTYIYKLEPNIEELLTYSDIDGIQKRELSYSNKQLIAREVELEKMRRFEVPKQAVVPQKAAVPNRRNISDKVSVLGNVAVPGKVPLVVPNKQQRTAVKTSLEPENKASTPLPNHLQRLEVKSVKPSKQSGRIHFNVGLRLELGLLEINGQTMTSASNAHTWFSVLTFCLFKLADIQIGKAQWADSGEGSGQDMFHN
ncbi:hypothetical protein NQ317_012737 [Molorchus minor]|uniref:AAA+ ATPase domain-containing protein n=1 Tax=Molorchus minor TaxID=1323400 RepID=A0ABQ9JPE2_9CUCU|nr:hypothetical protein NQ317_012737 [Molorchus minor]